MSAPSIPYRAWVVDPGASELPIGGDLRIRDLNDCPHCESRRNVMEGRAGAAQQFHCRDCGLTYHICEVST